MKEFTDKCVVLRTGHFRETDIWLKVLSPRSGLMTLFAFGGAKSRRRFCGCLDILNTLNCRIKKSARGDYLILQEACLLEGPENLRGNWRKMGMACNCSCFLEALEIAPDSSGETFRLVEEMRAAMKSAREFSPLFVFYFRFRLACILGFMPQLERCSGCGGATDGEVYFAYDEGKIICPDCERKNPLKRGIRLPLEGLDLLREVKQTFPLHWAFPDPKPDVRRALGQAMDSFVQYHIGVANGEGCFVRV